MIAARAILLKNVNPTVQYPNQLPLAGDFKAMQRVVQQSFCFKGSEIELGALATLCPRCFMFGVGVVPSHGFTPLSDEVVQEESTNKQSDHRQRPGFCRSIP